MQLQKIDLRRTSFRVFDQPPKQPLFDMRAVQFITERNPLPLSEVDEFAFQARAQLGQEPRIGIGLPKSAHKSRVLAAYEG